MKRSILLLATALIALAAPAWAADRTTGRPIVIDGETLEIGGKRYRLYGVDAPDLRQRCEIRGRTYDCGNVSRAALMDLVAGVEATCAPLQSRPGETGRARCVAGGYDLAEGMVHTGWALALPCEGAGYARIERRAERARRGLWQGRFTPPWEWRP